MQSLQLNEQAGRQFSPYEQTQLAKYGISLDKARTYGEMPVEYITGHVEFCGYDFLVNEHVLIPRIETENLVELVVDIAQEISETLSEKNNNRPLRILDVGTGSGAIAVSVGKKLAELGIIAEILASDISPIALELAKENTARLGAIVQFFESDLLAGIPGLSDSDRAASDKSFDLVIANLPYIPNERIKALEESVKDFEPMQALDGGVDGMDVIRKLIAQVEKTNPTSRLILEIDHTHTEEKWQEFAGNWIVQLKRDSFGRNRYAVLTKD